MIVPWLTSRDGTVRLPLFLVGPTGSWGDLNITTRWGTGACGMFEASWTMPLPPDFEHPLLRRGTRVELMDGSYRVGSTLILNDEPARGTGYEDPWQFTTSGIGREVQGENSYFARDGGGNSTTVPSIAIDALIGVGLPWAGRAASVPTSMVGDTTPDDIQTLGSVLTAAADYLGKRWGVDQTNTAFFASDPTAPSYHVVPGVAALGVADDDYASHVLVRYIDSTSAVATTVGVNEPVTDATYGHREYALDFTDPRYGTLSAAQATAYAAAFLAKYKGRLGWSNGLTLTSNQILTDGGVPADLSKVAEDVGTGCMVRLHGIYSDLLAYNGQTWLDIVIGEAKYVDGSQTIDLSPLGLAARDLAHVVEEITGMASAA